VTDPLAVTSPDTLLDSPTVVDARELERQVEYIVDDCFFTVGQVVGMRTTVDWEAVVLWRDHYRQKFLAAMMAFGNRWLQDRSNVTSVAIMLAERAVRYSEGKPSIDAEAARKAAADVERHCALHARRAARRQGLDSSETSATRIAGYWCTW
jgi:DNA polymerase II large subunit